LCITKYWKIYEQLPTYIDYCIHRPSPRCCPKLTFLINFKVITREGCISCDSSLLLPAISIATEGAIPIGGMNYTAEVIVWQKRWFYLNKCLDNSGMNSCNQNSEFLKWL
jgi:hypothetical protein